jgi:hypothetical protein
VRNTLRSVALLGFSAIGSFVIRYGGNARREKTATKAIRFLSRDNLIRERVGAGLLYLSLLSNRDSTEIIKDLLRVPFCHIAEVRHSKLPSKAADLT